MDTFCTPTSAAACWVVGTSLWCFIILYLSVNTFIIDDSQPEPVQYSTIRVDNDEYIGTSIMQITFETELSNSDVSYTTPLVPIFESVWNSQEIVALKDIISVHRSVSKDDIHVIMVAKRSQAVLHNGFLLSGKKSSNSNLVFAKAITSTPTLALAEILYFSECQYQINKQDSVDRLWVVTVMWYMEHHCKVWFGYPSQVWSCTQRSRPDLLLIGNIVSRVC